MPFNIEGCQQAIRLGSRRMRHRRDKRITWWVLSVLSGRDAFRRCLFNLIPRQISNIDNFMGGVYFWFFSFLEYCDSARNKWWLTENSGILMKYSVGTVCSVIVKETNNCWKLTCKTSCLSILGLTLYLQVSYYLKERFSPINWFYSQSFWDFTTRKILKARVKITNK